MDLDDILGFDKVRCTGDRARGGWYFDQDQILEALVELDIKIPVRLKFMTGIYRYGTHYNRKEYHLVTINQTLGPASANATIWHELAHCMQAERWAERTGRDIKGWHWEDYKAVDGEHGQRYMGNKYEIEARQLSEDKSEIHLVIFAP